MYQCKDLQAVASPISQNNRADWALRTSYPSVNRSIWNHLARVTLTGQNPSWLWIEATDAVFTGVLILTVSSQNVAADAKCLLCWGVLCQDNFQCSNPHDMINCITKIPEVGMQLLPEWHSTAHDSLHRCGEMAACTTYSSNTGWTSGF